MSGKTPKANVATTEQRRYNTVLVGYNDVGRANTMMCIFAIFNSKGQLVPTFRCPMHDEDKNQLQNFPGTLGKIIANEYLNQDHRRVKDMPSINYEKLQILNNNTCLVKTNGDPFVRNSTDINHFKIEFEANNFWLVEIDTNDYRHAGQGHIHTTVKWGDKNQRFKNGTVFNWNEHIEWVSAAQEFDETVTFLNKPPSHSISTPEQPPEDVFVVVGTQKQGYTPFFIALQKNAEGVWHKPTPEFKFSLFSNFEDESQKAQLRTLFGGPENKTRIDNLHAGAKNVLKDMNIDENLSDELEVVWHKNIWIEVSRTETKPGQYTIKVRELHKNANHGDNASSHASNEGEARELHQDANHEDNASSHASNGGEAKRGRQPAPLTRNDARVAKRGDRTLSPIPKYLKRLPDGIDATIATTLLQNMSISGPERYFVNIHIN